MKFGMKSVATTLVVSMGLATGALAADTIKMGVSIPAATHGWAGGVNFHAEKTKEALEAQYDNLDVVLITAQDPSKQANDLEDLVSVHGIDALVILPFESDPLTEPVRQVKASGAYVTVVDRGLSDPTIADSYVAGNNPVFGKVAGDYMREKMGGEGKVVVLRGIPTVIDDQRVKGFQEALEGSNIEILDMKHGNWNRDDAYVVMQDFLSRFPKIDGVWASDDDMAIGAIEAIRQVNREDEMFIVGGAGMKDIIKRVMDGDALIPVNVTYPPDMVATGMRVTALGLMSGVPVEGDFILDSVLVTPENAERYYYPDSPF